MLSRKVSPESDSSNNNTRKFHKSVDTPVGEIQPFSYKNDPYITEKKFYSSYANDEEIFRKSKQIGKSFHRKKRPKTTPDAIRNDKTMTEPGRSSLQFFKTTSSVDHESPVKLKATVRNYQPDDFKAAFDEQSKRAGDNMIFLSDIGSVVLGTIGKDCPDWVIDKFVKLCENISSYKRVRWEDFRGIILEALAAAERDCSVRRDKPSWLTRPAYVNRAGLPSVVNTSAYSCDFRPRTVGMNCAATTGHLFAGTSKASAHLPGFGGHVPSNTRNPKKQSYCNVENVKDLHRGHTLTSRAIGYLPGYTGHVSILGEGRLNM